MVSPITTGSPMMVWAVIMAVDVNSQPRSPSGPLRDSSM